jgi:hypothetical protein
MKKYLKYLTLSVMLTMVFSQCENALDKPPIGNLDATTFYQTEDEFRTAIFGAYSTLLNYYFDQFGQGWFQGILQPDDDVRDRRDQNSAVEEFRWLPTESHFNTLWDETYKGIMRSNVVIDQLPKARRFINEANKVPLEAEARFLRAYFHFVLARNWGNAPVVKTLIRGISDANLPNSRPGEIWDFIEEDLTFAKNNLPSQWNDANRGRADRFSAIGMLGKVKLYRAQWEGTAAKYAEAITEFNEIVNSGRFRLVENFNDNFRIATENNAESLFEIQMSRGDFNPWLPTDFPGNIGAAGSGRKIFMGPACDLGNCAPGANGQGYGFVHVTTSLQNEFEPNDPRRRLTMFKEGDVWNNQGSIFRAVWSITGSTPAKYMSPFIMGEFPPNITTNNERIMRYSDVLLMLAEAELLGNNNVNRAAELINQVRTRARNNWELYNADPRPENLLPNVASTLSRDDMMRALMHERRVELALECHRYDDLVRWHRAGIINIKTDIDFGNTVAQQNWSTTYLLKPYPQREMDLNPNLVQNVGY